MVFLVIQMARTPPPPPEKSLALSHNMGQYKQQIIQLIHTLSSSLYMNIQPFIHFLAPVEGLNGLCTYKNSCSTCMHAWILMRLFLWNVDKRCLKLFCFKGNLIRALLNSLNGRMWKKWLYRIHACSDLVEPFLWNVDKRCPKLFCFEGNLIRALLNSLNGWNLQKTVK